MSTNAGPGRYATIGPGSSSAGVWLWWVGIMYSRCEAGLLKRRILPRRG